MHIRGEQTDMDAIPILELGYITAIKQFGVADFNYELSSRQFLNPRTELTYRALHNKDMNGGNQNAMP
jgi:hypothetical protein